MKSIVFSIAVVFVGLGSAARAQNEQRLRDIFLSEAPQRWRELSGSQGCYRIETLKVERRKQAGAADLVKRYRYINMRTNGVCDLGCVEEDHDQEFLAKTIAVNDRYAFLISQRQRSGPWLLDRIDLHPSQGTDAEVGGYKLHNPMTSFPWLNVNNNMQLIDMVTNPTFKVIRASEQTSGEVRIEFIVTNVVKKVIEENYAGWMQFDRTRYWALTNYEMKGTSTREPGAHWATKCSHKYIDHPKGLPISLKMVQEHKGYTAPDKLFVTVTTEMDTKFSEDCPKDSEFELSAYGIAEPVGVAPKRNTLFWWFIGGGVIIALVGYFLIKRTRKM